MNSKVIDYIRGNRDRYLSELRDYISIPSISTLPENKKDILNAANWLKSQLESVGMEGIEIRSTEGHPIVRSDWLKGDKNSCTILAYGHYDVQPVDPLDQWNSPPFSPTIKGEYLYARGAADMKAQGHALMKALEAWKKCTAALPINVKILFEGEEELGSPHIDSFIAKNSQELKSEFCLNCDGSIAKPDLPSITYGLRGVMYYEVSVRGPKSDLHSGTFGGVVQNPAVVLSELIAGLHDGEGRVTLSGFYDGVRSLSDEERKDINGTGYSEEEWKKAAGVSTLSGEKGFTPSERAGARPTLDVNGMISGFTGEGQKTIIPASATAKISMRTVPYQNTEEIDASFRRYFKDRAPPTVNYEIRMLSKGPYALLERSTPVLLLAARALEESYGSPTVFKLNGGSVPVVSLLKTRLGLDSVIMGCGLPDAGIHGPNERLHLPTYYKGIEAYARFFDLLTRRPEDKSA